MTPQELLPPAVRHDPHRVHPIAGARETGRVASAALPRSLVSTTIPSTRDSRPAAHALSAPPKHGGRARPIGPNAASHRRAPATTRTLGMWVTGAISLLLAAINLAGARYYMLPIGARVRSPLHPLLRSSGTVGQTAGIIAVAIFVFLWLYPLRKRWRWLAFTGSVGRWLDVHIVAALSLPLLLAIHAAWRFGGVIGLGFWAMMIVCASGIVGRYLYVRIPRSRNGAELSLEEVAGQRRALVQQIIDTTGFELAQVQAVLAASTPSTATPSAWRALGRMMLSDLTRWRMRREIGRRWRSLGPRGAALDERTLDEVARCAAREIGLAQQVAFLHTTHRIFRWWHVAHRPIAVTALIAVVIHVAVVVAVGATWFW
jgi:hypothetical protein